MTATPPVVNPLAAMIADAVARMQTVEPFVIDTPFSVASGQSLNVETPHADDELWAHEQLNQLPAAERLAAIRTYNELVERSGRRSANSFLLDMVERYSGDDYQPQFPRQSVPEPVADLGSYHALECSKAIQQGGLDGGVEYCHEQGIAPPFINQSSQSPTDTNSPESAIRRMESDSWWKRKLKVKRLRDAEHGRIRAGKIGKGLQVYCSDICADDFRLSQDRAMDYMRGMEAVSDVGDVVDMADVLEGSLSNPAVRRAELMTRVWGFAEYAQAHGDKGEFYTLTAPSKYHKASRKYEGYSPRETQGYLVKLWAQIRAKLKREGLEVYGFRIVEPHKDSTVHWHMLLFMADGHQERVRAIIRDYALREDGDERGAKKARFQHESLKSDPAFVISYVGKYIAKNIDGHQVGIDHESGQPSENTAIRVRAWASRWGIRQFQQIGGAPVGVWRELRKLESSDDETIEKARQAADTGNWKAYLEAQGGALTPRNEQLIRTFNETCIDADTGEIRTSSYGEFISKVRGLESDSGRITTRPVNWTIQPKQTAETPNSGSSNSGSSEISRLLPEFVCAGQAERAAWLSGNNCTHNQNQGNES